MTIKSSGVLNFSDIQTEFGGTNPISLSEYYAGGIYVPGSTSGIPISGGISSGLFYGKSKAILTNDSHTINWAYYNGGSSLIGWGYSMFVGANPPSPLSTGPGSGYNIVAFGDNLVTNEFQFSIFSKTSSTWSCLQSFLDRVEISIGTTVYASNSTRFSSSGGMAVWCWPKLNRTTTGVISFTAYYP